MLYLFVLLFSSCAGRAGVVGSGEPVECLRSRPVALPSLCHPRLYLRSCITNTSVTGYQTLRLRSRPIVRRRASRYALSIRPRPPTHHVCSPQERPHGTATASVTEPRVRTASRRALRPDERRSSGECPLVALIVPQAECARIFPIAPHALFIVATAARRQGSHSLRSCRRIPVWAFPLDRSLYTAARFESVSRSDTREVEFISSHFELSYAC